MRVAVLVLVTLAGVSCSRRSLQDDGGAGVIPFDAASLDGGLVRADVPFPWEDASGLADDFPPLDAPSADANCGVTHLVGVHLAAEFLVVLDRSVSHDPAQWNSFRSAIAATITRYSDEVDWGLYAFPADGPACGAGTFSTAIDVPPMPSNAMHVLAHMFAAGTGASGTPTAAAIETAAAYMRSRTTPNPKFLMLVTDGAPSCAGNAGAMSAERDQAQADAAWAIATAAASGIPTFVVAPSTTSAPGDVEALNELADAGRYARQGDRRFHTELTIGDSYRPLSSSKTCAMNLQSPPPVPNDVTVTFNGAFVPRDRSRVAGWEYTTPAMTVIEFYGAWCDMVQASRSFDIRVTFGCPLPD